MHLLRGHHPTVSYSSPPILRCNAHSILCLVSHRCYLIGWHGRQEGGVIKGDKGTNATSQRSGGDPPLLSADAFLALHTVSRLITYRCRLTAWDGNQKIMVGILFSKTCTNATLVFLSKTCTNATPKRPRLHCSLMPSLGCMWRPVHTTNATLQRSPNHSCVSVHAVFCPTVTTESKY